MVPVRHHRDFSSFCFPAAALHLGNIQKIFSAAGGIAKPAAGPSPLAGALQ